MKWIEIRLSVDGEAAEAVAELLARYGHQGISIEQEGIMPEVYTEDEVPAPERLTIRAYLQNDGGVEDAKRQLEASLRYMNMMYPMPTPEYEEVDDTDWGNAWKVHYHPMRLGKRIVIRPVWQEFDLRPDDIELALDPGMAFGTGTHPTTQLCLMALEDTVKYGYRVLDLGTGSGILAIAAAKLGASHVLGLDTDQFAVENAIENIERNKVSEKITIERGSLENVLHSARRFDLIVVNILARIIIQMAKEGLGQVVRPGGIALFSGLTEEQADDVEAALRETGLIPHARRNITDWLVIECHRPGGEE